MHNVSSQLTLGLKLFLPTFWITFFGTLMLYVLFSEEASGALAAGFLPAEIAKLILVVCFVVGVLFFYYFFMRIKRVEMDDQYLYATNYYKSYRYPFHNIEKIQISRFLWWMPTKVFFKTPGNFGKKISFVANKQLEAFLKENPEVNNQLLIER